MVTIKKHYIALLLATAMYTTANAEIKHVIFVLKGVLVQDASRNFEQLAKAMGQTKAFVTLLEGGVREAKAIGSIYEELEQKSKDIGGMKKRERKKSMEELKRQISQYFKNQPKQAIRVEYGYKLYKKFKKANLSLYHCSNYPKDLYRNTLNQPKFRFLKKINNKVLSYKAKSIVNIEDVIKKYNLNPTECLLISGSRNHVRKASQLGATALHWSNTKIETEKEKVLSEDDQRGQDLFSHNYPLQKLLGEILFHTHTKFVFPKN